VPSSPHLLPDEAHQPPHRALLGVAAAAAAAIALAQRRLVVRIAVHAVALFLLLLVVAIALVVAVLLAIEATGVVVVFHAGIRLLGGTCILLAVAASAFAAAAAAGRAARRASSAAAAAAAALLHGVDDAVDDVAVGGRVPTRPEALVAAEAPAPHLRRVSPAAAAASPGRPTSRQQVGEHLLLLRRERRRQGQHSGRQHNRCRRSSIRLRLLRRRRVHPPSLPLVQLLHPPHPQLLLLTRTYFSRSSPG
ncbi:Os04g0669450, partial [Oryza sativa Japonica Group]